MSTSAPPNNFAYAKPDRLCCLFDEVDAHLHPRWQRAVVPAVFKAMNGLADDETSIQLIAVTHSSPRPRVPSSLTSTRTAIGCSIWIRSMVIARLAVEPWAKQGDALNWLVSDVFGLKQGAVRRSGGRDRGAAEALMRGDTYLLPDNLTSRDDIDDELRRVLPGHDPFWPRWVVWSERQDRRA